MSAMEEFPGLVQVKTCDTELVTSSGPGVAGPGCGMESGHSSLVTSVANNNNNNKFSRCEGCGELIMDRCDNVTMSVLMIMSRSSGL